MTAEPDATPELALRGYQGPLGGLLTLARAQRIDLAALPLAAVIDQLAAAVQQADGAALATLADWLVMAAWLVLLRSRLMLPPDVPAQRAAQAEADRLRGRLVALHQVQALAAWLDARAVLGRDVFARGRPHAEAPAVEVDAIAFLWAAMARFDDVRPRTAPSAYRPPPSAVHSVAEARRRILQRLANAGGPTPLNRLLPALPPQAVPAHAALWRRTAWATTFIASLELARQGNLMLAQQQDFATIHASAR
jgi:segregation and condensation protein A